MNAHNEQQPAEMLARRFHEAYERLAPSFGYETRTESRQFDPASKNGRLMIEVCAELVPAAAQEAVAWINPDDLAESPRAMVCRNSSRHLSCNERYTMPLYAAPVTAAPVDLDALAVNRYRPVPDGLLAYKVVAGDGTRSLFSGTMNECNVVARKLTEAFLDGAHVASTPAAPGIDLREIGGVMAEAEKHVETLHSLCPRASVFECIKRLRKAQAALIDASPKGTTLNEQFGSAEGLGSPKGGSEALDAARWRHARRILPISVIEDGQAMLQQFGGRSSEAESVRADAAIDAAMKAQSGDAGVQP